jgi:hypothetical protein
MRLADHPTVRRIRETAGNGSRSDKNLSLDADWLKRLARECGADDVDLVEIDRPRAGR